MMDSQARPTLTQFLIEQRRHHPQASGDFNSLILDIARACKGIARDVAFGSLLADSSPEGGQLNVQNEVQLWQDVAANDQFISCVGSNPGLVGMVSEEMDDPCWTDADPDRAKYLLAFDPLDGSSNVDVNVSVGSVFSILRAPKERARSATDFLQPGTEQLAAGYAIYGPSTMMVLTVGTGVYGFTLDPEIFEFVLTHPRMTVPAESRVFAINTSNSRFWEPPVRYYVEECLAGTGGPRGKDFNMRWIASLVAEAHRILLRGGVFLYPGDRRQATRSGRLRVLYEVNPIAWIVEQAGGQASTGYSAVLSLTPSDLHQRIGFVFGSRDEVQRVERYHAERMEDDFVNPLFNNCGLFRALA